MISFLGRKTLKRRTVPKRDNLPTHPEFLFLKHLLSLVFVSHTQSPYRVLLKFIDSRATIQEFDLQSHSYRSPGAPLCILSRTWHWPGGVLMTQEMLSVQAPLLPIQGCPVPCSRWFCRLLTITSPPPRVQYLSCNGILWCS